MLLATQQRLEQANQELDKLVGVRTRRIQSKLRSVTSLPEENSLRILGLDQDPGQDQGEYELIEEGE